MFVLKLLCSSLRELRKCRAPVAGSCSDRIKFALCTAESCCLLVSAAESVAKPDACNPVSGQSASTRQSPYVLWRVV